jgi:hypothetical protein
LLRRNYFLTKEKNVSLRDKWEFQFSAADLTVAAQAKVEHHGGRLAFWKKAQEDLMVEIKDTGLSIVECAAGTSYNNSGMGPQVAVDMTYQRRLQETSSKISEHTGKLSQYTGWLQVLKAHEKTFTLHADDYLFFFGK